MTWCDICFTYAREKNGFNKIVTACEKINKTRAKDEAKRVATQANADAKANAPAKAKAPVKAKVLVKAKAKARFISKFPFVAAVGVSGSLSKGYYDSDSDIDFFIITQHNRLWICRTLLMVYKKIFLLNSRKYFCPNYFISSEQL